jgi:hypothetical protein
VRYVVATDNFDSRADFEPVITIGRFHIYRIRNWNPQRATIAGGPGEVVSTDVQDETIRIRVRGAAAGARVRLAVSYFPYWHARLNGQELPIELGRMWDGGPPGFMEFPARDGEIVLRFEHPPVQTLANLLTLLGLLSVAGLMYLAGSKRARAWVVARLGPIYARVGVWAERAAVAGLVLVPPLAIANAGMATGRGGLMYDFRHATPTAVEQRTGATAASCRWDRENRHWVCPPIADAQHVFTVLECVPQLRDENPGWFVRHEQRLIEAFYIPQPADGMTNLSYDHVPIGRTIRGVLAIGMRTPVGRSGPPGTAVLTIDGQEAGRVQVATEPVTFSIDTSRWRGRRATVDWRFETPQGPLDVCYTAGSYR